MLLLELILQFLFCNYYLEALKQTVLLWLADQLVYVGRCWVKIEKQNAAFSSCCHSYRVTNL